MLQVRKRIALIYISLSCLCLGEYLWTPHDTQLVLAGIWWMALEGLWLPLMRLTNLPCATYPTQTFLADVFLPPWRPALALCSHTASSPRSDPEREEGNGMGTGETGAVLWRWGTRAKTRKASSSHLSSPAAVCKTCLHLFRWQKGRFFKKSFSAIDFFWLYLCCIFTAPRYWHLWAINPESQMDILVTAPIWISLKHHRTIYAGTCLPS